MEKYDPVDWNSYSRTIACPKIKKENDKHRYLQTERKEQQQKRNKTK